MTKKAKADEPLEDELLHLQQQVGELTEALQRERADALNVRRHHEQQLTSARTHAKAAVVRELLPVIDNFERALKHVPKDLEGSDFVKGVQGIVRQFEKTLADMGVQKIKTVAEPFNPHLHEAVSMEDGEGTNEVVSEELQSGYTLSGDVLRHAVVRVKLQ